MLSERMGKLLGSTRSAIRSASGGKLARNSASRESTRGCARSMLVSGEEKSESSTAPSESPSTIPANEAPRAPTRTGSFFALPSAITSTNAPSSSPSSAATGTRTTPLRSSTCTCACANDPSRSSPEALSARRRTSAVPVAGSTVGATASVRAGKARPASASTRSTALCPGLSSAASLGASGARSSTTETRATSTTGLFASSASPAPAKTVATTPANGARSSLRPSWFFALDTNAAAPLTAACACASRSFPSPTSCAAATPAANAFSARLSFACAFTSCARACASCASAWATASRSGVPSRRASTCPSLTASPSPTSSAARRPATRGPSFTSRPGGAESSPDTSTICATSPFSARTASTMSAAGAASSSPLWQPQSTASTVAQAVALESFTGRLLHVRQRLLRGQGRVARICARRCQLRLCLQDRRQRRAPQFPCLARHADQVDRGRDDLGGERLRPRRRRVPPRVRGAQVGVVLRERAPDLRCGHLRLRLCFVHLAGVPAQERQVEGDAQPQTDGRRSGNSQGRRGTVQLLEGEREIRQRQQRRALTGGAGERGILLMAEGLDLRVLRGALEQLVERLRRGQRIERIHRFQRRGIGRREQAAQLLARSKERRRAIAALLRCAPPRHAPLDPLELPRH